MMTQAFGELGPITGPLFGILSVVYSAARRPGAELRARGSR